MRTNDVNVNQTANHFNLRVRMEVRENWEHSQMLYNKLISKCTKWNEKNK